MDVLVRVEKEQAYSNLLLNQMLQSSELTRSDAGLATELVYGTIQRLNTLDYFMNKFLSKGIHKLEPWVRSLLRLSFYQLIYLDRIPEHAIVNEAVTIAGRRGHKGISGLVNGVLRAALRRSDELQLPAGMPHLQEISLRHSHPEWLVKRWTAQFGEETASRICEANNVPPHTSLRMNRLKTSTQALLELLTEQGYTARLSELAPDGIVVNGGGNMALSPGYEEGLYSIQDESSMLVAEMLSPLTGMTVLDCCAAPGGKTAHIAEKMGDQGHIHAFDIHPHKRKLIDAQVQRLGIHSVSTDIADAAHLAERFPPSTFDRILLDAPCSGLGVIRRKPDLKWVKSPQDITEISHVQDRLLQAVSGLLKPDGILIYSTCTLESNENEKAVERFLNNRPEFSLDQAAAARLPHLRDRFILPGMLQILPHQYGSDGFFIAALRKQAF